MSTFESITVAVVMIKNVQAVLSETYMTSDVRHDRSDLLSFPSVKRGEKGKERLSFNYLSAYM